MFQAPAPECLAGICPESPWSDGGRASWGKLKSCLTSEQVKTVSVPGSCVCKRFEVQGGEKSFCGFQEDWFRETEKERELRKGSSGAHPLQVMIKTTSAVDRWI